MIRHRGVSFFFLLMLAASVPSVQAQFAPEIYVASFITIESGLVSAECGQQVVDPTASYYEGVTSDCSFASSGSSESVGGRAGFPHWQCSSWLDTSCVGPVTGAGSGTDTQAPCTPGTDTPCSNGSNAGGVPVEPGQLYSVTSTHELWPFFAGDVGYYVDPLDYFDNPVYMSQSAFFISPNINPWFPDFLNPVQECFDNGCGIELAITEDFVTAQGITPSFDSLGPTQTSDFTSSVPANWFLTGSGSLAGSGTSARYTAPTHIPSETTVQVHACDTTNPNNCAVAEVTLVPIDVSVNPPTVDLIPGVAQQFTASINFPDLPSTVKWSTIPASVPPVIDSNGLYTPPPPAQVTSPLTVTIRACSTVDDQRCKPATATVKPVTITISAPANIFLASSGATLQFSASVIGTNDADVTWSLSATTTPPAAVGSINANGLYQAPVSPVLQVKQDVQVKACLVKNNQICSPVYVLTLVPPVVIAAVAPTFNAGQSLAVAITGSGFGSTPLVTLDDPFIAFSAGAQQNPNNAIQGVVSVPVLRPGGTVTLTVTDTTSGLFLAPQSSVRVTVNPVVLTPAIVPATATLQEGQSQQFSAVFACRTAGNVVCQIPQTALWSFSPNLGTLTADGLYTATASIGVPTQVFVKACAAVIPLVCTNPAVINLTPTVVTVSPASATLTDGRTQQFTASVTGNSVTSVVWSISPAAGTISSSGLYTAPNPVPSPQTVTVKACSTVDGNRCGTALVNLIAIRLSPASLTFAPQALGTSSPAQTMTLTNGNPATLTISSLGISSSEFALGSGGTCGTSLGPNASCTVNIVFTPAAVGTRTATLTVNDNVASSPQTANLSGMGTQVSLAPSLAFDPQIAGTASAPRIVTLTNSSPSPLAITSIGLPAPFLQTNNCGTSLAANASCAISVTFSPATVGSFTGTLTVVDNAANSPQTVSLSGNGITIPSLTGIAPSSVTVGSTGFTLTVNGANFVRGLAVIQVNGQPRATAVLSSTKLTAQISAADVAALGQLNISVLNQSQYGGLSGTLALTVTSTPIPLIGSLSPPRVVVGSAGFTLLVNGSDFPADSVVQINGVNRATTFNGAGQLAVSIAATEIAHSGFLNVGVSSPSIGNSPNTVALSAFRYGDLNFDDVVNVLDLNVCANELAGNLTLLDDATADLNLDGHITVQDLSILANYLAGNIHSLPVTP